LDEPDGLTIIQYPSHGMYMLYIIYAHDVNPGRRYVKGYCSEVECLSMN